MATETRADRWKMQNSKMGSRKMTTKRWVMKMATDIVNMTIAVVRHDAASWAILLGNVSL
jgi:hypothetical protein